MAKKDTVEPQTPKKVESSTWSIPLSVIELNKGQIPGLPKNPRFIKNEKFKKLKKSIEENPEMLELRELLVYPYKGKYVLIGGNMRYRALKELGYEIATCKIIDESTSVEQLKAYTIKDNSGFGEWDFEAIRDEWDIGDVESWGVDVPEVEKAKSEKEAEDDNYTKSVPEKARSKEGDMFALGEHRLICGDSTKIETLELLMDGSTADLIVTDPPYNVNYESKSTGKKIQNDQMSDSNFQEFLTDAFKAANSVLKLGGAVYIWHVDSEGYNFRTACKRVGWKVRQCLIWNKNSLVLGRQDYQWKHEPVLYLWKEGAGHYFTPRRDLTTVLEMLEEKKPEEMKKEELLKIVKLVMGDGIPSSVIDEDKPVASAEHPTMKPLRLIGRQIKNSSRPNEIVLDPFGGSGSTMMAAEQLGRRCYMVELDPRYIDVIIDRWEELTGKTAVFLGNVNDKKEGDE